MSGSLLSPALEQTPAPAREISRSAVSMIWPLASGAILLGVLWFGPLPERAQGSFAAHMVMHMGVVALAAPLLALGLARAAPKHVAKLTPGWAIAASLVEFVAVWAWHAPGLHDAARASGPIFVAEQTSFLGAGLLVWASAIGTAGRAQLAARASGVGALLVTSMHMTLLGALLLLSPRPLYACADICSPTASLTPLGDQQLGGVVMLIIGGASYMGGALVMLASILKDRQPGDVASVEAT